MDKNKVYLSLGALLVAGTLFTYYHFKNDLGSDNNSASSQTTIAMANDDELIAKSGGEHHHGGHHSHHGHHNHNHHGHHHDHHHHHHGNHPNHWHHNHNNAWFHHNGQPGWDHHHWNHWNQWHNSWHNWYWYNTGNTYPGYLYDPNYYFLDDGIPSIEYEYDEPEPVNIQNYNTLYQKLEKEVTPHSSQYMDDYEYEEEKAITR